MTDQYEHNADRASRISTLIAGYCGSQDDPESDLTDVLTDILHFCDSRGVDFEDYLRRARMHHEAEATEEEFTER